MRKLYLSACAVALGAVVASTASAEVLDRDLYKTVMSSGEVVASRAFTEPELGWELLIRHDGQFFICSVITRTKDGYKDFVQSGTCIGPSDKK
jgi:hypothetical protein